MVDEMDDEGRAQSARARIGSCLDGWTLVDVIGCGGTATVYRATGPGGDPGAVKVMHAHLVGDSGWARRLQREATLLSAVRHPGIVRLLHVGSADCGPPFLVMALLEGRSLEALRQASGGALPVADVLRHVSAVLEVLEHTHALRIVHRDLKPSNVFVPLDGDTRVLDFGIASAGDSAAQADAATSATRGLLGTPAYMAPEQARGRWTEVDHRTDLWAVGATMFTLLTGELVHVAVTENERLGLAMTRRARSVASLLPNLDDAIVELVDRSLSYEREARFQSATAFREALARIAPRPLGARAAGRDATPTVVDAASSSSPRVRRLGLASAIPFAGVAVLLATTVVAYRAATAPPSSALVPADVATKESAPGPMAPLSDTTVPRAGEGAPPPDGVVTRARSVPPAPSAGAVHRSEARAIDKGSPVPPRADAAARVQPSPSAPESAPVPLSRPEHDDLDARSPTGSMALSADDLMDRRD